MARCMNALFLLFFVSGQSGSVRDPGANLKREVCESWCGCVMACLLDGCHSTVSVPTRISVHRVSVNTGRDIAGCTVPPPPRQEAARHISVKTWPFTRALMCRPEMERWASSILLPLQQHLSGYSEDDGFIPSQVEAQGLHWSRGGGGLATVDRCSCILAMGLAPIAGPFSRLTRIHQDRSWWTEATGVEHGMASTAAVGNAQRRVCGWTHLVFAGALV